MRKGVILVSLAAAAMLALAGAPASAAVDAYLYIEGVPGESFDKGHEGWIEIQSWSWGASNPTHVGSSGAGAGAGKVSMSSFSIMKRYDKASPVLARAAASGEHFASVKLEARKSGGGPRDYVAYVMQDVMISGITPGGDSGGDRPTESVSLNFTKIEMKRGSEPAARGKIGKSRSNIQNNRMGAPALDQGETATADAPP